MRLLKRKEQPKPSAQHGLVIVGSRKEIESTLPPGYDGNTYKPFGEIGNFLTIDPGLGGTGWALWSRETFDDLCHPINSGSISFDRQDRPWWWTCNEIACRVAELARQMSVFNVYAELPKFMEGGKGLATARDGDLIKLTAVFGAIIGAACNNQSRQFCPVPIQEWKGNMPKDVFEPRILAKLKGWKPTTKTSHEIDAVGIGLFVKGHL